MRGNFKRTIPINGIPHTLKKIMQLDQTKFPATIRVKIGFLLFYISICINLFIDIYRCNVVCTVINKSQQKLGHIACEPLHSSILPFSISIPEGGSADFLAPSCAACQWTIFNLPVIQSTEKCLVHCHDSRSFFPSPPRPYKALFFTARVHLTGLLRALELEFSIT